MLAVGSLHRPRNRTQLPHRAKAHPIMRKLEVGGATATRGDWEASGSERKAAFALNRLERFLSWRHGRIE